MLLDFTLRVALVAGFALLGRGVRISDPLYFTHAVETLPEVVIESADSFWRLMYEVKNPTKLRLPWLASIVFNWSDEYLGDRFGHTIVRTEFKVENRTIDYCGTHVNCTSYEFRQRETLYEYMNLREFLQEYGKGKLGHRYVISQLSDEMARDVPFFREAACASSSVAASELNFWLSSGASRSSLHYDMNHQIMCQIDGVKEWHFWDLRNELHRLSIPMWNKYYPDTFASDDSPISVWNIDTNMYPDFRDTIVHRAALLPGECLLIPARHWLHAVESFGPRNMAFSVHFKSFDRLERRDLNLDDIRIPRSCDEEHTRGANHVPSFLSEVKVLWPFPGEPDESSFNTTRMGKFDWTEVSNEVRSSMNTDDQVTLLTGLSEVNPRIAALAHGGIGRALAEPDVFKFGGFWREIFDTVSNSK